MKPLDIAIAGCGPAGLAAALYLTRDGHRVTLYERFEAPRPLGSGLMLQSTGRAVLADLGLGDAIHALGARIATMYGRTVPSGRLVLDVRYAALGPDSYGLAVHRAALFGVLHEAVLVAGIGIVTGFEVAGLDRQGARTALVAADGRRTAPCDLVIDALGSRSPLPVQVFGRSHHKPLSYGALWASLRWPENGPFGPDALEQRYDRASVMVGVLPIGRRSPGGPRETAFFWSLKPADYPAWRAAGLEAWKDRVRGLWPETEALLAEIREPEQLVLAHYGHHTLPRPAAPGIAFIGDCAHAASPQLGQGANMALLDAMALARALREARDVGEAMEAYVGARRRHVRFYQLMSALFTPFYQSDSTILPLIRDRLVAPMTRLPGIPRLLAGLVSGTLVKP